MSLDKAVKANGSALAGVRRKTGLAFYVIVANDVQGVEKELRDLRQ